RCRQAVAMGLEAGDFTYASYGVFYTLLFRFAAGDHLNSIAEEVESFTEVIHQTNNGFTSTYLRCFKQVLLNYCHGTRQPTDLSDEDFDEEVFFAELKQKGYNAVIFRYCLLKQQLLFLADRTADALAITEVAESYARAASGSLDLTEMHFYKSLILLSLAHEDAHKSFKKTQPWQASARLIRVWAASCRENFQHKALLVAAEEASATGDEFAALNLYDRAIELARTNKFQHHVALANKLAAKFHLRRGRKAAARGYLGQAYRAYINWGAARKAAELVETYAHVGGFDLGESVMDTTRGEDGWDSTTSVVSDVTTTSSTSTGTSGTALDLEAVLKASRALSGEMELPRLLARLMALLLESAGAERGFLLLPKSGELSIEASGNLSSASETQSIDITESIPVKQCNDISQAIVNYVARTNENIVVRDPAATGRFASDPYIAKAQPRSVLCTPLAHQGKQIGLLYLENNLTSGAFTLDRLRVLYILSAQAAISIDNARLYASITKSERKFRSLFEDSNDAIFLTNQTGELLDVNRATLQLFGYSASEVAKLPGERLYVDVENQRDFRSQIERLGAIRDFEVTLRKKDGTKIDCLLTAATVRIGSGAQAVAYQVIIRDITERKRAAQLLADYNRTLKRTVKERTQEVTAKNAELSTTLDELKRTQDQLILNEKMPSLGTLSAGIAHELKNPLNFINNFAALSLRSTTEFNEDVRDAQATLGDDMVEIIDEFLVDLNENIETIQTHGKRADGIIQSMLFHARSQGGPAQPTDLNTLLAAELNLAYHGMRVKIEGFDLVMETDYDPNLPHLSVVPQDLSRVFLNIMNNGIDAAWEKMGTAGEGFVPELRIQTREIGDAVEVRVRDNGTGIPESLRAKIFTPFYTSKPPGKGTGLGLSLSHDIIVRKYGGDIQVESEVGAYSEFIITLPKQLARAEAIADR
ncbi:MAG: ATP-binding protein, partial [Nannocystaceae bacterium]